MTKTTPPKAPSNVVPLASKGRRRKKGGTAAPPPPAPPPPPEPSQGNLNNIAGWVGRDSADVGTVGPSFQSVVKNGRDEMVVIQLAYARHVVANRLPGLVSLAGKVEQALMKKLDGKLEDFDVKQLWGMLGLTQKHIEASMAAVQVVVDGPKPIMPPLDDPNPSASRQLAANLPERSRERMRRLMQYLATAAEQFSDDERAAAARPITDDPPTNPG